MKTTRQLVLVTVVVALVSACGALGSPAPAPGSSEPRTPGEQAAPQATPITVAARVQDLTAAVGALGGLSSYRFSRTSTGTGIIVGPGATVGAAATRRIIVNGTLPRALEETTGISGFPSLSILVIGTDAWSRTGSDAWKKATTDDHPTCGETGQDSSSMKRCTFEAMTDVFAGDRAMAPTFVRIGDGEVVDGVATTHLRSDAGFPVPAYGTIPATTDLWIATAGGYPIRETIDGQGITATMGVTNINDPANRIEPPTGN